MLLVELCGLIDITLSSLTAGEHYDLEKSLDFQCAKQEFEV